MKVIPKINKSIHPRIILQIGQHSITPGSISLIALRQLMIKGALLNCVRFVMDQAPARSVTARGGPLDIMEKIIPALRAMTIPEGSMTVGNHTAMEDALHAMEQGSTD